jgi:hypothetical protein
VVAALKANGGKFVLYFDYDTADISPAAHQEIIKHIAFRLPSTDTTDNKPFPSR